MVIATQNPIDMDGTYPLPEAQLDRFLMRTSMGYPDLAAELEIVAASNGRSASGPHPPGAVDRRRRRDGGAVHRVHAAPEVLRLPGAHRRRHPHAARGPPAGQPTRFGRVAARGAGACAHDGPPVRHARRREIAGHARARAPARAHPGRAPRRRHPRAMLQRAMASVPVPHDRNGAGSGPARPIVAAADAGAHADRPGDRVGRGRPHALGWALGYTALTVAGAALAAAVVAGLAATFMLPRLDVERVIEPPRVERGSPALGPPGRQQRRAAPQPPVRGGRADRAATGRGIDCRPCIAHRSWWRSPRCAPADRSRCRTRLPTAPARHDAGRPAGHRATRPVRSLARPPARWGAP